MYLKPERYPALVLNADFRPLSYFPLSVWPWQEAVKASFLDRVNIIQFYDRRVSSPSCTMQLPSVIALKEYVRPAAYTTFSQVVRPPARRGMTWSKVRSSVAPQY